MTTPRNVAKSVVMKITVERKPAGQVETETLIVPVLEGRREGRFGAADLFDSGAIAGKPPELTLLQHAAGRVLEPRREGRSGAADLFDSGEIAVKPLELTLLPHAPGVRATRVLLVGAGKPDTVGGP